ncbi:endo-1,3(4)-beta-glucanase [Cladophialophora yegresii CBS 114405]|uniref:endo-1,3(4)-beta-glucanase n=1 Tax=Cladophialophora yegresii CBS 114405 TaxID=1182544 RepID=W9W614_9EURO|nr:endo-1,3(4)-beta-glucanase [Cladophialophora yegresii CBS 114405]EXJ60435.1 endo-1,3(4)-beta-glucanase [Cladophialophora yegresii CBS 114405]
MRTSLITLSILAASASASYVLEDDYSSDVFADMFDFFTGNDPTNGYVNYISYDQATSAGLYKADNGSVYMGVDATNVATGRGRDSVRISTKKVYNHGLVILDLAHMPAGACGSWPAFWMLGPNWPTNGEIDIIEGVNSQSANTMTLHTNAGCSITNTGAFSGSMVTDNCDVNAPDQAANAGCSIDTQDNLSFGSGFNANGGGVYATEWTSEAISMWFFPRNSIPSDIANGQPDPSNWGLPKGQFTGGCDIDEHVKDQQLVFDVTFCGDWAGSVWSTDSTCSPLGSTCQAYVQNNPSAFQDTYWLINGLKVYTDNGAASAQTMTPTTLAGVATTSITTSQATTPISVAGFPATTTATTFVTLGSSPSSSTTEIETEAAATSTPIQTPSATRFVTVTAINTPPSAADPTVITAAAAQTSTWSSSSGPWTTASFDNGSWENWAGGNGNGNGNGGRFGGRGGAGGRGR